MDSQSVSLTLSASSVTAPRTVAMVLRLDDGLIVDANQATAHVLGFPVSDLVGRRVAELGLLSARGTSAGALVALLRATQLVGYAVTLTAIDGSFVDGLLTVVPFRSNDIDHALCLIHPINEIASGFASLRRELTGYRQLYADSIEGVWRTDRAFQRLREVNPALVRLLGYPTRQHALRALGSNPGAMFADAREAADLTSILRDTSQARWRGPATLRRADGSAVEVLLTAHGVGGQNDANSFIEGSVIDVGPDLKISHALRQSDLLMRTMIEHLHEGVCLIQHGRVLFANPALHDVLGVAHGSLIGQNYLAWIDPRDLEAQRARKQARDEGSRALQIYEVVLRPSGGQPRLCEVRAVAVEWNGALASIGAVRSIGPERAAQERLQSAEAKYRSLFEQAPVGMFQLDSDLHITAMNPAFVSIFGFDDGETLLNEHGTLSELFLDPVAAEVASERLLVEQRLIDHELVAHDRFDRPLRLLCSIAPNRAAQDSLIDGYSGTLIDITARRAIERELEYGALHDSLTGLLNRHGLERKINALLDDLAAQPSSGPCAALIYLDVDAFRVINDSLGYSAGDSVLIEIAQRLRRSLGDRCHCARHGGDEFALLASGLGSTAELERLCTQLRLELDTPFQAADQPVYVAISIGVSWVGIDSRRAADLMREADTALNLAKIEKRPAPVIFDETMRGRARGRLNLAAELRAALDGEQFTVHYQPVHRLDNSVICGMEALLRWQHPQRGLLAPDCFIDVARESGLMRLIDERVRAMALRHMRELKRLKLLDPGFRVALNIEAAALADLSFADRLARDLHIVDLEPHRLALEMSESILRADIDLAVGRLNVLRELGVSLVVDDFGTAYSSLASFTRAPFTALKIDRSFLVDATGDYRKRAIVATITRLARDLGIDVIAEGVEQTSQVELLATLECPMAQGFLLSRPMPFEALVARLRESPSRSEQQAHNQRLGGAH